MVAPVFATQADLIEFVPDLTEYGLDNTNDLQRASNDVLNRLTVSWWTQAASSRMGRESQVLDALMLPAIKPDRLNAALMVNITCYRALSAYILPKLSSDMAADGDSFGRKSVHFEKMYEAEWNTIRLLSLYDFDGDGNFEEIERVKMQTRRTSRA